MTVTDGTQTASLTLLGQYSAANFNLARDDEGGTIITESPRSVASDGTAAIPVLPAPHDG